MHPRFTLMGLLLLPVALRIAACTRTTSKATGRLSTPGPNVTVMAQCRWLTVPENRDDPGGHRIDANAAVCPALASSLRTLRQTHDIVLVDQRPESRAR